MVFSNLPAELQVEIFSYLHRPALERMSLVNRRSNEIVKHYERLWPLHRLTLVISGESHLYRLHNFDACMTLQVTHIAFYRLLRKSQIEFILLTEDPVNPLMNLDHLPRQLFRFRRYWTDATVDFRQLPITRAGWNPVLNLFANADRFYFHAVNFLFPVQDILASHHRHRVAEARMHPPTPRLIEYLRQPRTDGGSGRRLLISEGCFNTYVFFVQLVNDYMNLESPPPGPYAVIVLQPKEQWNDYPFYSRILRQLLLYATGPRNAHAG
ncbi:hypothetical protein AAVH_33333, partial [Aphelenchoides avenae]